jgi:pimeloyl-ACP methyl ester carboxylesterase
MMGVAEITLPVRLKGREYRLSAWFRDAGPETVVFVHGLGCSKENWRAAWGRRELRGKSLLAFDLIGFGHSPRPHEFNYTLETQAEFLAGIIDAYAVRRIHMVAHSMGGTIALLLPNRTLARFESMILVEPRLLKASCGIAAETAQGDFERFKSEVFPRFRKRVLRDSRTAFDLDRADLNAFYQSSRSLIHWTQDDEMLARFDSAPCRKTLLYGGLNQHLQELAVINSAMKLEIPGAGHFVMHDRKDTFYRDLAGLISSAGKSPV